MLTRLKRYLVIAVLLGMGGWLTVYSWNEIRIGQRLGKEGIVTQGKVLDHSTSYRSKEGLKYRLTVEFTPTNHDAIVRTFKVESGTYYPAVETRVVAVRYLRDDPSASAAGETVTVTYQWLVSGAFMFICGLYVLWFFGHTRRQIATLCVEEHEYATVNAIDYRHLDIAFYEEGRAVLETHGYRFLADREDLTFRRSNGVRIALRCLVSREGATTAGLYHLRPRWYYRALGAKDSKVIDLETRFTNGEWIVTSNAQAAGVLTQPPGIDAIFLSNDTCLETVIESHSKRLVVYLQKHPEAKPCLVATLEDVDRLAADLQLRKARHRRATGLTQEELQRIADVPASPELAILHDGIAARLKADQKKAA